MKRRRVSSGSNSSVSTNLSAGGGGSSSTSLWGVVIDDIKKGQWLHLTDKKHKKMRQTIYENRGHIRDEKCIPVNDFKKRWKIWCEVVGKDEIEDLVTKNMFEKIRKQYYAVMQKSKDAIEKWKPS